MDPDLERVWGRTIRGDRAPRVLGIFAHPDDEVFCVGGTFARCADAGAVTALVSLTQGEGGQIRDAEVATRRTLGPVRLKELGQSAAALGVDEVTCLDLGDGRLATLPLTQLTTVARAAIDEVRPDVVVTFGPDGATGHPDHVASCAAVLDAVRGMAHPPRLLHARFPMREQMLVDVLVDWLASTGRFTGSADFGHSLKLFADGSSMLGFAADHLSVEWFPVRSYVIEQGEPANELFCILAGEVDILIEGPDGTMRLQDTVGAGSFVGEDGLASGRPRNAHVVARSDVTCLVFAPRASSRTAARGPSAPRSARVAPSPDHGTIIEDPSHLSLDVTAVLDRKVAALVAHRSQYAMHRDLLPSAVLERLLGVEHFAVVALDGATVIPDRQRTTTRSDR